MNHRLKDHEKRMREALDNAYTDFDWLLDYHKTWITFMQHERLIHLLVTITVALILIIAFAVTLMVDGLNPFYTMSLDGILVILLGFYIFHYYQLENGVQKWYGLYDEIIEKVRDKGENHD